MTPLRSLNGIRRTNSISDVIWKMGKKARLSFEEINPEYIVLFPDESKQSELSTVSGKMKKTKICLDSGFQMIFVVRQVLQSDRISDPKSIFLFRKAVAVNWEICYFLIDRYQRFINEQKVSKMFVSFSLYHIQLRKTSANIDGRSIFFQRIKASWENA